jgi:hypothetical protein
MLDPARFLERSQRAALPWRTKPPVGSRGFEHPADVADLDFPTTDEVQGL